MTPYLHHEVFVRRADRAVLRAARVMSDSVEWPGGIDLSYDTLYLEGKSSTAELAGEHTGS